VCTVDLSDIISDPSSRRVCKCWLLVWSSLYSGM